MILLAVGKKGTHSLTLPDYRADEAFAEHATLMPEVLRAAEHLLILAHETTLQWRTDAPLSGVPSALPERRSARRHFQLQGPRAKEASRFRDLAITRDLQGTPLFGSVGPASAGDDDQSGVLFVGDALALLWEIEQAFSDMHAETPG
jgi:hypothetical protein